jgi:DNA-binding response OmpR family regulator
MRQILIIEPDVVLADIYSKALATQGYKTVVAGDAQTAISLADEQKPDLIVMEVQLASHNGIEFIYELRSYPEWQSIPIIIQSLVTLSEFNTKITDHLGVISYLYKSTTTLFKLINEVNNGINLSLIASS